MRQDREDGVDGVAKKARRSAGRKEIGHTMKRTEVASSVNNRHHKEHDCDHFFLTKPGTQINRLSSFESESDCRPLVANMHTALLVKNPQNPRNQVCKHFESAVL